MESESASFEHKPYNRTARGGYRRTFRPDLRRPGSPLCRCERETWSHRHTLCERGRGSFIKRNVTADTGDVSRLEALPLFKDGGSIILNSSVSNVLGLPGLPPTPQVRRLCATSRGWTLELKDRKIRVNCMSPGAIDTPALATTTGPTAEQAEQAVAQFTSQIPLGRRGKPEEIAAAVVFLASDESSYITGVDLAVDGGMAQV